MSEKILPRHIAVVMDGNGRWAKKRLMPRTAGHKVGANNFKTICRYANSIGIECMTFYAFSTENWKRPKEEVDTLMTLFAEYLRDSVNFKSENIKLCFIGDRSALSEELQTLMANAEKESADCTGMRVNLAINYGGRDEILFGVKNVCKKVSAGEMAFEDITADTFDKAIYTADCPPLDLFIRPGGEYRISNFLLWQSAYAELYFCDTLWPDFSKKDLDMAIDAFAGRNRRFGGV